MLEELKTVRLIYGRKGCGAVAEVSVEQLAGTGECRCPKCQGSFHFPTTGQPDPLTSLAWGIQALAKSGEFFRVEFVIPAND
jgi:hypothetical protein